MQRFLMVLAGVMASAAWARPVSYVDSTMAMAQAQPWMVSVSVDHTFFRRLSAGVEYQWLKLPTKEIDFAGPELNLLIFRHNADDWQANLFLTGAFGAALEARQVFVAGFASVEADAESRRFSALASGRVLQTSSGQRDWQLLGRVGVAPVVAEANELNPWLLVQYQYMPNFKAPHVISPVVRLLYQGFLVEVGASLRGDFFFNVAVELS